MRARISTRRALGVVSAWMALSCAAGAAVGCADHQWSDPGLGEKVSDGRWFDQGVLVVLGPQGFEAGGLRAGALLTERVGAVVEVPVGAVSVGDVVVEARTLPLRHDRVDFGPLAGDEVARLEVAYAPLVGSFALGGSGAGCSVGVTVEPITLEVSMSASRDVAGRLSLSAQSVRGVIAPPLVTVPGGCVPDESALRDAVAAHVFQAIEGTLTADDGVVAALVRIAEQLAGLDAVARLDVDAPGAAADGGHLTVALAPSEGSPSAPLLVATDGMLVTPLRVGLDAAPDACGPGAAPFVAPPLAGPAPVPDFEGTPADVALALRRDVLREALTQSVVSGLGCALTARTTLGEVASRLPDSEQLLPTFGADAPVVVRVRMDRLPLLSLGGSTLPIADVTLPDVRIEAAVVAWDVEWSLASGRADLALTGWPVQATPGPDGLILGLGVGDVLELGAGQGGVDWAALARVALGQGGGLPLFALPSIYPYPLVGVRFELRDLHLLAYADLDDSAAARTARRGAPLVSPRAGCTAAPVGGALPVGWLWIAVAFGAWWAVGRRAFWRTKR